jgi:hypothetical protein
MKCAIFFLAMLVACASVFATTRDPKQKAAFMRAHPCPAGVDKGSIHRCKGYVVDHKKALACGGPDRPSNMQWQTIAQAKAKDKVELLGCRK